ncbi:glycosyltransferase family 4 protein [Nocardioides sp. SOB77]|uniref:Glycosyltransferase family 4 protein n=1 Tax=Nocardioides oceani TaxID=3058369 RepID=A0ABT8FIN5_9ACTN|nr:glycosyltransferase family 4 protein [Nocardioides oceani]MDN4174399.1 glycosyltransferase family 4 protein [Nocardioides oceani]
MRTLMVIAEMGSGGAEAVVADLAADRLDRGDEVAVASDRGWRTAHVAGRGADLVPVPLRRPGAPALARSAARLRRNLRQRPADLLHTHNVRATLAAHLAQRAAGRRAPLVATVHGLAAEDYPRAARVLDRCADVVVAVSADVADRLASGGLPTDRLRVVENAAPALRLPARAAARAALGLPADQQVALAVSRLVAPKRPDLLVDAWSRVPGAPLLLLAGDGPARPGLERRVADAGLADRVRLLGDRHDVDRLLAAADLLLLASDREGLPVSVLEAMGAGVPVAASAVGGLTSLAGAVELVAEPTVDAWAASVRRLLEDPGRRRDLAAAAGALVEERFSPAAMTASYDAIYTDVT